jgi:quercetin dioxygenase-like cupin family protein
MLHRWNQIAEEQMNPEFARRVIHTERITVAKLRLKAGGVVPRHHHENEQVSMVESGKLQFHFDDGTLIATAGEVVQIAPNRPHSVDVLEDSVVYDLFAPIRSDWLRGDDAYLRKK